MIPNCYKKEWFLIFSVFKLPALIKLSEKKKTQGIIYPDCSTSNVLNEYAGKIFISNILFSFLTYDPALCSIQKLRSTLCITNDTQNVLSEFCLHLVQRYLILLDSCYYLVTSHPSFASTSPAHTKAAGERRQKSDGVVVLINCQASDEDISVLFSLELNASHHMKYALYGSAHTSRQFVP